jgi:predicted DNA-binding transcriptional regulator
MNTTCDAFLDRSYAANEVLRSVSSAPRPTYALNLEWSNNTKDTRSSLPAVARMKVMSMMTSFLTIDEGIRDVSEQFLRGMLSDEDSIGGWIGTSLVVSSSRPTENIERTKERLMTQVSEHRLHPIFYKMKDRTKIIEFLNHPSRLVCAIDDDGVQLLWRNKDASHSDIIKNNILNFSQVLQKIEGILAIGAHPPVEFFADSNSYALAC